MHKRLLVSAAVFGGLAVALGAFGAHGLEKMTTDERILHGYQTGVQYQMYHALALLAIGFGYSQLQPNWMRWASVAFVSGILLFSGSLYLLTFLKINGSHAIRYIGPLTPFGGLCFILGWLFLLIAVLRKN